MRIAVIATAVSLSLVGMARSADTVAAISQYTNIPAQDLAPALRSLAKGRNFQIIFASGDVSALRTPGAVGEITADEALKRLLRGTGLTYRYLDEKTVAIIPTTSGAAAAPSRKDESGASSPTAANGDDSKGAQRRPLWGPFRLAQAVSGQSGGNVPLSVTGGSGQQAAPTGTVALEEVIVTANRRTESVQNTAMSITAITSADIDRRGLSGMNDYLNSVPGTSHLDLGIGRNATVIRGISLGPQDEGASSGQTVGYYLGDVPLSDLSWSPPDIKLVDMERVELLRGPQGTLYGAGSLSGAIRNIPNAPVLGQFAGEVEGSYSNTARLGDGNYDAHAVLNVPLIGDTLAIRFVGYRYDDSGYVQNVAHSNAAFLSNAQTYGAGALAVDQNDMGHDWYSGGRISALWHPVENLNVTLSYLTQTATQNGFPEVQLGLGLYQQTRLQIADIAGGGGEHLGSNIRLGNLLASYEFPWATLVSSTSYSNQLFHRRYGIDYYLGDVPAPQLYNTETHGFNEEIRLISKDAGPFKYVAGLYFQRTSYSDAGQDFYGGNAAVNPFGTDATLYVFTDDTDLRQRAAFGELTYDILKNLSVTAGGRRSDYQKTTTSYSSGPLAGGTTLTTVGMDEKKTTSKANISYKPVEGATVYAEFSQGFRFGKPITPYPVSCDDGTGHVEGTDVPINGGFLKSDSLNNYELGGKFLLADKRVSVDAALYRIDWKNLPVLIIPACKFPVYENAGKARSQGIEIQSQIAVLTNLLVDLGASVQRAHLVGNNPGVGSDGDRLPGSPNHQYSVGVTYRFNAFQLPGYVRADYMRLGGFYSNIQRLGPEVGDYGQLNMKAGLTFRQLEVSVYGNNLTNAANLSWYDAEFENGRADRLRPRTIGVDLRYGF
jgi:outer membrane receptor protein involved in Fe transport